MRADAGPARAQEQAQPLLACRDLVVGYHGVPLLPAIDFTLHAGEICAVIGRNGAGKTTWFRTLLGLMPPVSGRIESESGPLRMGYIPQRSALDPTVPLRARDVVLMGVERELSFLRPGRGAAAREAAEQALDALEARDLARRPFRELSEGQKQRVLMARLLAGRPQLAVLDEPTAAMDEVAERETLERIDRLRREHNLTVLWVTHHLPVVMRWADQVVFLDRDAHVVASGTPAEILSHPAFVARYGRVILPEKEHA
jgi:zinc transport system ATP-binding protein